MAKTHSKIRFEVGPGVDEMPGRPGKSLNLSHARRQLRDMEAAIVAVSKSLYFADGLSGPKLMH